ncbi:MAG: hypothetical protein K0S38_526 [Candidatus Paceibacter sp.]|jgi:hypothetical protein|nr:hypothetical protein [Candidatus Paceibacter sp.]
MSPESFEEIPITDEQITAVLIEKGVDAPEVKELFGKWTKQRDREIKAEQDSAEEQDKRNVGHRGCIESGYRLAKILFDAGFLEAALERIWDPDSDGDDFSVGRMLEETDDEDLKRKVEALADQIEQKMEERDGDSK